VLDTAGTTAAPIVSSHTGARALQDFPRYLTDDELRAIAATGGLVGLWPYRYHGRGVRDVPELIAHARYVADLVGPEHLTLGSDMNGLPGVMAGYTGETHLSQLTCALLDAGFDHTEVAQIVGGNALRVLTLVEQHASNAAS
jgi:membrane dipeptidase